MEYQVCGFLYQSDGDITFLSPFPLPCNCRYRTRIYICELYHRSDESYRCTQYEERVGLPSVYNQSWSAMGAPISCSAVPI